MPEVFDVNDEARRESLLRDRLPLALGALRTDTLPLWGAMAAQQMVEHLAWTFAISTGRILVECRFPPDKQQRYKAFLFDNGPTPRGFTNPELVGGLPALLHPGLDAARAALQQEVERFLELRARGEGAVYTHPIFGGLTSDEWSRTHYKHAMHHLLQFGLIR